MSNSATSLSSFIIYSLEFAITVLMGNIPIREIKNANLARPTARHVSGIVHLPKNNAHSAIITPNLFHLKANAEQIAIKQHTLILLKCAALIVSKMNSLINLNRFVRHAL